MASPSSEFGQKAERAACAWLEASGFRILDRNWRRPWGELDIVAVKDGVYRFMEVKAAARSRPGMEPFVRADGRKMLKVARTARTWLAAQGLRPDVEWQMDVISVIMGPAGPEFEHFENI